MLKSRFLPILAGAAALVLVVSITAAHATVIVVGPGSSIDASAMNAGTVSFSPTPATKILEITAPDFKDDFPNQNPSTIASGIAALFSVPTPTLTANNEKLTNPFTESVPLGFNYVPIHNAQGELVFFYNTLQTSFTLSSTTGALSNARFYDAAPAPSIGHGHGLSVIIAVGGLLFGAGLVERGKRHRLLATATAA